MAKSLNVDRTDHLRARLDAQGTPLGQVKEMNDVTKRMLCVIGASEDGYVRLYRVRDDQLEVCAQINLRDRVLLARPLFTDEAQGDCERQIAIVT